MKTLSLVLMLSSVALFTSCSTTSNTTSTEPVTQFSPERPIPYPVDLPWDFQYAVEQGTRTTTGEPGPVYFTNYTKYVLNAELSPQDTMLYGEADILYTNNSPDTLYYLIFELSQNLHQEGVPRKDFAEITGGFNITRIAMGNEELAEALRVRPTYEVQGTNMIVYPSSQILPGETTEIEIDWNFKIPQQGASGRMGYSEDNLFFIAYWFPHIATYDDLQGWYGDHFLGNAEFYHGFGDYEINITAPEQWLVMSTGSFLNPEEVLAENILERYRQSSESDEVVTVVAEEDFGSVTKTREDGSLTWRFKAENVRDVAFSATLESQWDALRTPVGNMDNNGQTGYTQINAFWRSSAPLWIDVADYTAHSISYLSDYTGISYPWPHMTSVEGAGIIGGGMEFPMITVMGSYNHAGTRSLYDVTAHEIAHMWIPMIVSTNERRHAWIDEGATTFHEAQARWDKFPNSFDRESEFKPYLQLAGSFFEGEIMRWSDFHYPGPAYGTATYPKPGTILIALQGLLGEEVFTEAWQTFMQNWAYKHPTPYDLFHTFESVSGMELDWFWRSWYFETWVLDQAVANVTQADGKATIVIEDKGEVPMPVDLTITFEDGTETEIRIGVKDWLAGKRTTSITINVPAPVNSVVIDADNYYPDMNRFNNRWRK